MPHGRILSARRLPAASPAILFVLVTACGPVWAQEESVSEFPEDLPKVELAGAAVEPGDIGMAGGGRPVMLLGAEMKQEPDGNERVRELHVGKSFGESLKAAGFEAAAAKAEIRSASADEQARYSEWIRGVSGFGIATTPLATLRLTQFESKLELACPRTVAAGEPIRLYVKSAGGADSNWRVSLVRPDSSDVKWHVEKTYTGAVKLESRKITAGKKALGGRKGKVKIIRFDTHPDDGGKHLGVLVERVESEQFQHVFWVAVSETPPRPRLPPPELPPDHPLADPLVRGFLGDLADVAEENWRRGQASAAAAP